METFKFLNNLYQIGHACYKKNRILTIIVAILLFVFIGKIISFFFWAIIKILIVIWLISVILNVLKWKNP